MRKGESLTICTILHYVAERSWKAEKIQTGKRKQVMKQRVLRWGDPAVAAGAAFCRAYVML